MYNDTFELFLTLSQTFENKESNEKKYGQHTCVELLSIIEQETEKSCKFECLYRNLFLVQISGNAELLYQGLKEILVKRCKMIYTELNEVTEVFAFFSLLHKKWEKYKASLRTLIGAIQLVDRVYGRLNRQDPLHVTANGIFKSVVLEKLSARLTQNMVKMCMMKRAELMEPLSKTIQLIEQIDITHDFYFSTFHKAFCEELTLETRKRADEMWIESKTVCEYVRKTIEYLKREESDFTKLPKCTVQAASQIIIRELALNRLEDMFGHEQMSKILDMPMVHTVSSLYKMCLASDTLQLLIDLISRHIVDRTKERLKLTSSQLWIPTVLETMHSMEAVLNKCCSADANMQTHFNKNIEQLLSTSNKFPELLAMALDETLRVKMYEEDMRKKVDEIIALFRYLNDKDAFEKSHKAYLCKRLLVQRRVQRKAEQAIVRVMNSECGHQFTQKLCKMLADYDSWHSSPLRHAQEPPVDWKVATSGIWPLTTSETLMNVFPSICVESFIRFSAKYSGIYTGRRLAVCVHQGSAEVEMTTLTGRRVTLVTSTLQMLILNLMNGHDGLTVDSIADVLSVSKKDVLRNVLNLCAAGQDVLKMNKVTEMVEVNEKFDSLKPVLKISKVSPKLKDEEEKVELRAKTDEERKFEVEAAIVRLMKRMQSFQHDELINAVQDELKSNGTIGQPVIKQRLEALIDREFIERDVDNMKLYLYVP